MIKCSLCSSSQHDIFDIFLITPYLKMNDHNIRREVRYFRQPGGPFTRSTWTYLTYLKVAVSPMNTYCSMIRTYMTVGAVASKRLHRVQNVSPSTQQVGSGTYYLPKIWQHLYLLQEVAIRSRHNTQPTVSAVSFDRRKFIQAREAMSRPITALGKTDTNGQTTGSVLQPGLVSRYARRNASVHHCGYVVAVVASKSLIHVEALLRNSIMSLRVLQTVESVAKTWHECTLHILTMTEFPCASKSATCLKADTY